MLTPLADSAGTSATPLPGGRTLARNTVFNLIGQGLPFLVAIFAIPPLIKGLGTARFGVLTLAWMVIGYFSLFDLGIGRALTKLVSEKLGSGFEQDLPDLIGSALGLMGCLGLLGAILAACISPWLVRDVLKIPESLLKETVFSFYLLSLSIPVVISNASLRGLLEAYQRFDVINLVQVPMGIFTFLGPLAVLSFSTSLFHVIGILVIVRILTWGVNLYLCMHLIPPMRQKMRIRIEKIRPLLSFGSWLTVSNIVGPIMLYMDRLVVANRLSITAVAYYTTPYEVVTKLLIIPSAIISVVFPAFSMTFARDSSRVHSLYKKCMKYVFVIMFPIVLVIVIYAKDALGYWLNNEFAENSFRVAQILVVGVLINTVGLVSQSLVQASGRPDLTAKLHLIELPLYIIYLFGLINAYGINGAALAWLIRVSLSAAALFYLARKSVCIAH